MRISDWSSDVCSSDLGYKIPRGGAFRYVSAANYFGEIVLWTGWAVMSWTAAGALFAIFTVSNLLPRALSHHRWYRENFADYPRERRALIPWQLGRASCRERVCQDV